jgi:hypothetical protein
MRALNEAWRAIFGSLARSGSTANARRPGLAGIVRPVTRAAVRRWRRLCAPFRQFLQDSSRNNVLAREEALRKERRAQRRSLLLLVRLLNPEQRQEFRNMQQFHVIGGSSGSRYRIRTGRTANIDVLRDDGRLRYRLCVVPVGGVPVYDVMAAQMLHLQDPHTEEALLMTANIS